MEIFLYVFDIFKFIIILFCNNWVLKSLNFCPFLLLIQSS